MKIFDEALSERLEEYLKHIIIKGSTFEKAMVCFGMLVVEGLGELISMERQYQPFLDKYEVVPDQSFMSETGVEEESVEPLTGEEIDKLWKEHSDDEK